MNLRPLCTAMVCPTISGTTVERRDQVLMTFLSLFRFITSTFSSRGTSTKGPFFSDLDIVYSRERPTHSLATGATLPQPLFASALHDEPVRHLPVPRLVTLGRHAPRRDRMAAAGGLAFAAAERMVHRVHRDAAHVRLPAQPPSAAGLADRDVLVVDVADLADRRQAGRVDLANLARRHLHRGVLAVLGHQLHGGARAARDLA